MTHGTDIESPATEPVEEPRSRPGSLERAPGGGHGIEGRSRGEWIDPEVDEVSLLSLASALLRHWKLVVFTPLVLSMIVAVIALVLPRKYTAQASFVPESEAAGINVPAGISGLASQFGVSLPTSGGNSPAFYADVINSRTIRDAVLLTFFPDPRTAEPDDSARFVDIVEIEDESAAKRLEEGREKLHDWVTTRVDGDTRILTLWVETEYPEFSAQVANYYVELLQAFNLDTRRSNARAQRQFIEGRVEQARAELLAAEEELKRFLERNRQFRGSPELQFQYDRLQRQVEIKQQVLTTLTRQYEEARIREVNDTPVITVIDRAVPPVEKSSPKRRLMVIMAFLVGAVLGVFGAFGRELLDRAEEADRDGYVELTSSWEKFKREAIALIGRRRSAD